MENEFCKKNEAGINFKTKRKTKKKYLTPLILSEFFQHINAIRETNLETDTASRKLDWD